MTQQFQELLLSELRMVSYQPGNPEDMTDEMLCQAVTVNVNLQSLGFVLRPDDLLRLAVSPSLKEFYDGVRELVPDVAAEPMYPGFPQQVMEMSEAEFRLHQMIHYFSTYGVESLLGRQVQRGWLPTGEAVGPRKKDTRLLEARVIELIAEQDAPFAVLKTLLNRRERLTNPELELAAECAPRCQAEQLQGLQVRFKENLSLLFPRLMNLTDRKAALLALSAVCAHAGDVFRCAGEYLSKRRWHLTTGEKKLLVRLLEQYTVKNLRENMMQSLRLRERNLKILQHLDYNRFARSPGHREAVRALRSGELMSWQGIGELLLREHSPEALAFFARRPGYMLRMINRLLSLSYRQEDIRAALVPAAGEVSGHLALKTIRMLKKRRSQLEQKHREAIRRCMERFLQESRAVGPSYNDCLMQMEMEIADRRRAAAGQWRQRRQEALRNAYRPVEKLMKTLAEKEKEIETWRGILAHLKEYAAVRRHRLFRESADSLYGMIYQQDPRLLEETVRQAEEEYAALKERYEREKIPCDQRYDEQTALLETERAQTMKDLDKWEENCRESLRQKYEKEVSRVMELRRTAAQRRDEELAALEKRHQAEIRASRYDGQAVSILKEVLKEHFCQAETPLKGKRVCLDLKGFDLAHSVLETEDRSRDGGCIRSGLAFRIPEKAKYVRFFVYWNDPNRVDIDLHAGGKTAGGENFHIGWNADFRNCGAVYSGDITHSDAAEYIDIDLSAPIREVYANVSLFGGRPSFKEIETCFVGMMAVDKAHQNVEHYDPANCFFTHRLTQNTNSLFYGYIDVRNRFVRFIGQPNESGWGHWAERPQVEEEESMFSLKDYLDLVLEAQEARQTPDPDQADVVLTMEKSLKANAVSLADSNFFLEC